MLFAAPTKLAPNHTRRPSVSAMVKSDPTVGPSSAYMPPAMAANTICSDTPMPDTVSGLRYMRYCPNTAPPSAVSAALMTVTRSFSRVTSMPMAAASSSSSEIASSASRPMPRSIQRQTSSPSSQTSSAMA